MQREKPPEWWEKQKGSRGIRRGQWYRLIFQFPIRQGWRDRSGRCKPGVFTHRTVATARNRASGFGGDWRVRQQLPVGVGPDDRMPPGSRELKVRVRQEVA